MVEVDKRLYLNIKQESPDCPDFLYCKSKTYLLMNDFTKGSFSSSTDIMYEPAGRSEILIPFSLPSISTTFTSDPSML